MVVVIIIIIIIIIIMEYECEMGTPWAVGGGRGEESYWG
jgi:hypothetical protein